MRVSEEEFQAHFKDFEDELDIKKEGLLYKVNSGNGLTCPHWKGQCTIYGNRPMECDLYPHTLGNVFEGDNEIIATFHARTECPLTDEIRHTDEKAKDMIQTFFEGIAENGACVRVINDQGVNRVANLLRRVKNKLT